jgi:tetratricopeptide (TPR) repeat protein
MPQFNAVDVAGQKFEYAHGGGKPLMTVFLSAGHQKSDLAVTDVKKIVARLASKADAFRAILVITYPRGGSSPGAGDPNGQPPATSFDKYAADGFTVLPDSEYEIWGKFGIIATPTVVISDANDKVLWVEAGYGHSFAPVVQTRLRQGLGLEDASRAEQAGQVRTVSNNTVSARAKRHLHMAELLKKKGRTKSAIREIEKARLLDPNSVPISLEVGWMCCEAGDAAGAIRAVVNVKGANRLEKSKLAFVLGWAYRLSGDLDTAQKHLLEAIQNNPRLDRAYFELGRVYQEKKDFENAAKAYFKALSGIYDDK